ncbi:hypothetical protein XBKQ1_580028 [Xenorhabdus bovienii str. kraussei Quebec]|uniref:Uncharacterized protein n=1 Tax=Xenorhabdus bovienii str. kraussei Quebec TaxID=1398203 RepID=A0A077PLP4_XENBV|nr:hypothetical protein XBKQ1_580028 [Xenorhabdus bovienii str. kraussei Quebec]
MFDLSTKTDEKMDEKQLHALATEPAKNRKTPSCLRTNPYRPPITLK